MDEKSALDRIEDALERNKGFKTVTLMVEDVQELVDLVNAQGDGV